MCAAETIFCRTPGLGTRTCETASRANWDTWGPKWSCEWREENHRMLARGRPPVRGSPMRECSELRKMGHSHSHPLHPSWLGGALRISILVWSKFGQNLGLAEGAWVEQRSRRIPTSVGHCRKQRTSLKGQRIALVPDISKCPTPSTDASGIQPRNPSPARGGMMVIPTTPTLGNDSFSRLSSKILQTAELAVTLRVWHL
ncbi:unnamed protein product [Mycena citricolor]|uniref:Uncharacterized protein n=1 Tax=Mycena citricolor TaxID=2018698 RepID=A0AAD2GXJ2_9AGAR|nr:unnamed protein product [Mycena citricolor]